MAIRTPPPSNNACAPIKHKHARNFDFMLIVLSCIRTNRKVDFHSLCQVLGLDKQSMQLWLHTLTGMNYIQKTNTGEYVVTEKGRNELRCHRHDIASTC